MSVSHLTEGTAGGDPRLSLEAPPKLHDTELGDRLKDLIVAVFRMAVTDLHAEPYYEGEPLENRYWVREMRRVDAERFLVSTHADDLARLIGLSPLHLRRRVRTSTRRSRARA